MCWEQGKFYWLFPLWLCNVCFSEELSLKAGRGVLESLLLPSLFKTRQKWCKETDQKRQRTGYATLKLVQENLRVILSIVIWTPSLLHGTVYSLGKECIWGNRLDSVTVWSYLLFTLQCTTENIIHWSDWKMHTAAACTGKLSSQWTVRALPYHCTLALMWSTWLLWKACVELQHSHMEKTCLLSSAKLQLLLFKEFLFSLSFSLCHYLTVLNPAIHTRLKSGFKS